MCTTVLEEFMERHLCETLTFRDGSETICQICSNLANKKSKQHAHWAGVFFPRTSRLEVSCKKSLLKKFAKFTIKNTAINIFW